MQWLRIVGKCSLLPSIRSDAGLSQYCTTPGAAVPIAPAKLPPKDYIELLNFGPSGQLFASDLHARLGFPPRMRARRD
jgi:hypothetical protein